MYSFFTDFYIDMTSFLRLFWRCRSSLSTLVSSFSISQQPLHCKNLRLTSLALQAGEAHASFRKIFPISKSSTVFSSTLRRNDDGTYVVPAKTAHLSALKPKTHSLLPTLEEFHENPAKTAEDWVNSLPPDSDLELYPQSDHQTTFNTLIDYVKRLQDINYDILHPHLTQPRAKDMNQFFEGVRGVGKTSITRAVCQFVDAMREHYGPDFHVVSFYYNCEEGSDLKRPRVLLAELLDNYIPGFSKRSYKDMSELVRAAFAHKIRLFVVFDELQCKYVPRSHDCFYDNYAFVVDLLQLSKECRNVATVITGSSVRAKRFAFHQVDDLEPAAQFAKNYPNLNNSVCSFNNPSCT